MKNKTIIGIVVSLVVVCLFYIGINIFTAIAAQKTSDKILDEFVKINENLEKTNQDFDKQTGEIQEDFNIAYIKAKFPQIADQYELTFHNLDSLKELLHGTKDTLISIGKNQDDFDSPTEYMIEKGNAEKLKLLFETFIKSQNTVRIKLSLPQKNLEYFKVEAVKGEPEISWEMQNFFHLPLAGAITNLSYLESEALNMQVELMDEISALTKK